MTSLKRSCWGREMARQCSCNSEMHRDPNCIRNGDGKRNPGRACTYCTNAKPCITEFKERKSGSARRSGSVVGDRMEDIERRSEPVDFQEGSVSGPGMTRNTRSKKVCVERRNMGETKNGNERGKLKRANNGHSKPSWGCATGTGIPATHHC